jgi:hypothetical protein
VWLLRRELSHKLATRDQRHRPGCVSTIRKRLMIGLSLAIIGLALAGSTVLAYPAGCWYTGYYYEVVSYTCNSPYCTPETPDAKYITRYNQWQCPDGSTGYDSTVRLDSCVYWLPCR